MTPPFPKNGFLIGTTTTFKYVGKYILGTDRSVWKIPLRQTLIKRLSLVEHAFHVSSLGNIPTADVLIKVRGKSECPVKIANGRSIPAFEWFIKFDGVKEHKRHTGELRGFPTVDILIKIGVLKHIRHIIDVRDIPRIKRFVKKESILEHICHGGDPPGVPAVNIAIKSPKYSLITREHFGHVHHARGVPIADLPIETNCLLEHFPHGGHFARVPASQGLVEVSKAVKGLRHVRDGGRVPAGGRSVRVAHIAVETVLHFILEGISGDIRIDTRSGEAVRATA